MGRLYCCFRRGTNSDSYFWSTQMGCRRSNRQAFVISNRPDLNQCSSLVTKVIFMNTPNEDYREEETMTIGGKLMANELTRHNVPFGKPEVDGGVLNFCELLNNEPSSNCQNYLSSSSPWPFSSFNRPK